MVLATAAIPSADGRTSRTSLSISRCTSDLRISGRSGWLAAFHVGSADGGIGRQRQGQRRPGGPVHDRGDALVPQPVRGKQVLRLLRSERAQVEPRGD